jgi:Protein of unknown function (DUF1091)
MECFGDPSISQNTTCSLLVRQNVQTVVYGVTLIKPQDKIWIRVTQMKRNRANQYLPGIFDVTQDVCSLMSPINYQFFKNFITMFEPGHFEKYKDLMHPCPYSGRNEVQVVYRGVAGAGGSVMGRGEYKTRLRLYDEVNRTIYEMNSYYAYV